VERKTTGIPRYSAKCIGQIGGGKKKPSKSLILPQFKVSYAKARFPIFWLITDRLLLMSAPYLCSHFERCSTGEGKIRAWFDGYAGEKGWGSTSIHDAMRSDRIQDKRSLQERHPGVSHLVLPRLTDFFNHRGLRTTELSRALRGIGG